MTWDPPSDSDLDPDKPAKASHARRVRDLSASLAARETGSPWINGRGAWGFARLPFGTTETATSAGFAFSPRKNLRGTFTVPAGVTRIEVIAIGGGGCGGAGLDTIGSDGPSGGGGGGAGAVHIQLIEVSPGEVFPVTLGAGGHPTLVSPYVDVSLDDFELGDGGRTTFGAFPRIAVAGGGKRGFDGDGSSTEGLGGEGGGIVLVNGTQPVNPSIFGAQGGQAFRSVVSGSGPLYSGRGAASFLGAGGAGRVTVAGGNDARCAGAGGGGAYPAAFSGSANGGRGGTGIVILRY